VRVGTPPVRDLVLLGGGHSHIQVLKAFGMQPLPGLRLTVVCREVLTPYSGMLPGHVAGCYDWRETHIDLGRLARFAQARLIEDEVIGLDPANRSVTLRDHPPLRYDLLSINTGAVPEQPVPFGVAVKPIGRFLPQWRALRERVSPGAVVGIVGGGAGGVELALAMRAALAQAVTVRLFAEELLPGSRGRLQSRVLHALRRSGVDLLDGFRVADAGPDGVRSADGRISQVDQLFWVTRVAAPAWPREAGLATDERGFVLVDRMLRTVSQPDVFAAGDVAALQDQPRPKAGVFAVREGPVLAANLRRAILGEPLRPFRAQRRFLAIIGTGDGRAIASRGAWTVEGAWVWRWKDRIDRRFMERFSELPLMTERASSGRAKRPEPAIVPAVLAAELPDAERCGGCAAKIAADPLRRVLARLPDQSRPDVSVGIGDDAAVVRVRGGRQLLTVDGFRSLIDDPYRFGRIVAHHSLNDIFAMGGRPAVALAMATVPLMAEPMMEQELYWMLRGAVEVLNAHGAALVGGHSAEAAELSLALSVTGHEPGRLLGKGGLQPGDRLVLNKPLGTGVLLAADMRAAAPADHVAAAVRSMETSNAPALAVLERFGVSALTDVTGFGLLGHLGEMLRASGVGVRVDAAAVPAQPGARELRAQGIVSSIREANSRVLGDFECAPSVGAALRDLLVDPQTSGGLLAGIPGDQAEACVAALWAAGYPDARAIGVVTTSGWIVQ